MSVKVKTVCVGALDENCHILYCDIHKTCFIIDPGDSAERILKEIESLSLTPVAIINTHCHADHAGAVAKIKKKTGIDFYLHPEEEPVRTSDMTVEMTGFIGVAPAPAPDKKLADNQELTLCDCVKVKVLFTPGHTPGGVCFYTDGHLISGDTLFRLSIGRSDFPGGDAKTLIRSIKTRLLTLPGETIVYPGHGENSDIATERKLNPFLQGQVF